MRSYHSKQPAAVDALRYHKHFNSLWVMWCGMKGKKTPIAFESFEIFFAWAVSNGYEEKMTLMRKDSSAPFEPNNCFWQRKEITRSYGKELQESIHRFNETVSRIRAAYHLPPLPEVSDEAEKTKLQHR